MGVKTMPRVLTFTCNYTFPLLMISSDQNIETISRLITNAKKYSEMKFEHIERNMVEKLSTVISTLIVGAVIFVVGIIVLVFFSAALVVAIAPHVGGYLTALLIVSACHILLLSYVFVKRQTLIMLPIRRALAKVFFDERAEEEGPAAEEMFNLRQNIISDYTSFTTPQKPTKNKMEQVFRIATKAWGIADGVILGFKLYKKFNSSLRRKK